MKPEFITFTGIDNWTELYDIHALSLKYPIEWGILFSPKRQGSDPRYPDGDALSRFMWSNLRLSAHLCGAYSDAIMEGRDLEKPPVDFFYFRRIQVNHAEPKPDRIIHFRNGWGKARGIAQTRANQFPADTSVDWLFDRPGGRGETPAATGSSAMPAASRPRTSTASCRCSSRPPVATGSTWRAESGPTTGSTSRSAAPSAKPCSEAAHD